MAILGPFDLTKGSSPGYSFMSVPPGFTVQLQNCRIKSGAIIPRWSQVKTTASVLGGGTNSVTGLTSWIDAANSVTALVAISNAKIYTTDVTAYTPSSSALTFTDRTGATTISSSSSLRYTMDSLNGILIVAGNSAAAGVPLKVTAYNANAAVLGGTPPKADCVKVVNNIAFLGRQLNASTTYSTLNWSNVSDPETWSAANSIEVNKKDGEQIMALGAIGSDLYIFKQSTIWRLSTITQTVTGIATLGPLQLVVKGIGCCGPLALDNLPNGDIVFVGFDGHFYEFDGSNVFDVSRQPYPGPNAYDSGEFFDSGGLNVGVCDTQVCVKTWRGIGEVWIGYNSNIIGSPATNLYNVFSYDYLNRIWQGNITATFPKCFAVIPISSIIATEYESNDILFHGNATGNVFARGNLSLPVDESGTAVEFKIATTVELSSQASNFVPRSLYFILDNTQPQLTSLKVFVAYDTDIFFSFGGTPIATFTGTQLNAKNRIIVPLVVKQEAGGPMPTFMTLVLVGTGTGLSGGTDVFRMGAKFYVSDEIIR